MARLNYGCLSGDKKWLPEEVFEKINYQRGFIEIIKAQIRELYSEKDKPEIYYQRKYDCLDLIKESEKLFNDGIEIINRIIEVVSADVQSDFNDSSPSDDKSDWESLENYKISLEQGIKLAYCKGFSEGKRKGEGIYRYAPNIKIDPTDPETARVIGEVKKITDDPKDKKIIRAIRHIFSNYM